MLNLMPALPCKLTLLGLEISVVRVGDLQCMQYFVSLSLATQIPSLVLRPNSWKRWNVW